MTLEIKESYLTVLAGYGSRHGPVKIGLRVCQWSKPTARGRPPDKKTRGKPLCCLQGETPLFGEIFIPFFDWVFNPKWEPIVFAEGLIKLEIIKSLRYN